MTDIRFDGRVAVVTGAGQRPRRAHALELARRGARVVVNDPGGESRAGGDTSIAERVAAKSARGRTAVADTPRRRTGRARSASSRPRSTRGAASTSWSTTRHPARQDARQDGHARLRLRRARAPRRLGLLHPCRARAHGRRRATAASCHHVVGRPLRQLRPGQLRRGEDGLVGLMNALRQEIGKYDIRVNTVAPVARDAHDRGPAFAASSRSRRPNACPRGDLPRGGVLHAQRRDHRGWRQLLLARAGRRGRRRALSGGVTPTAEWVAANWAAIADMGGARPFDSAMAALDGSSAPSSRKSPTASAVSRAHRGSRR